METPLVFAQLLFLLFSPNLPHPVKAPPQSPRTAGVFLLTEGGRYSFTLDAARAACLQLNATIASRAQVERALQRGLETCKFGWTADRIAVIPRLAADVKCGKGKTGVVTWATGEDQTFGVFCFDASDLEDGSEEPTTDLQSSTSSSTLTPLLQTSTSTEPPLASSAGPPPPGTAAGPESPLTSASCTASSAAPPSTSTSGTTAPSQDPASASQPVTTTPARVPSTPVPQGGPVFSESPTPLSTKSPGASLRDLPTVLIILASILTFLMAAGVAWCYKLNFFRSWLEGQQDVRTETEMWKHSDSEENLCHGQEGDLDRKYSSDITLCVNPEFTITPE